MTKFIALNKAIQQYHIIRSFKLKGEPRSQIERAALSVCLNLSEGNGKFSPKDRRRFFNMAHASQKEVQTGLLIFGLEVAVADEVAAISYRLSKG